MAFGRRFHHRHFTFGGGYYAFDRLAPEYTAISVVLVAGLMLWFASRGFWPPIPPDCLFCKRDTDARFNAVPIAIAQVADRSQLGAMNRENIRAEIRFRAKPSRLPVLECKNQWTLAFAALASQEFPPGHRAVRRDKLYWR